MRSSSLFALILASLTLTASAQEHKTPKAKPYHSESKAKQSKGVVADKKLTPQASNSQELRRVEQQTARSASSKARQRERSARVVKAEREKPNPPIHFSSATGRQGSMNNQGKNPYKGRVRQKGSGSH